MWTRIILLEATLFLAQVPIVPTHARPVASSSSKAAPPSISPSTTALTAIYLRSQKPFWKLQMTEETCSLPRKSPFYSKANLFGPKDRGGPRPETGRGEQQMRLRPDGSINAPWPLD